MMKSFAKIAISLIMIILPVNSYADFGKTCTAIKEEYTAASKIDDLVANSVYGYVRSLIDIENCGQDFTNNCSNSSEEVMEICVKQVEDNSTSANKENSKKFIINKLTATPLSDLTKIQRIQSDPNLASISIIAGRVGNDFCVVMPTIYGFVPLACKQLSNVQQGPIFADKSECSELSTACRVGGSDNISKVQENYSGSVIRCVYESLDSIFFDPRTCDRNNISKINMFESFDVKVKPFAEFFSYFRTFVIAALTLYVIFFGINLALKPGEFNPRHSLVAAAKVILVLYFSIGIDVSNWFSGKTKNHNGITQFLIPLMVDFSTEMSSYVLANTSEANMCYFSPSEYENKYKYYALWDSMDCRLNIYLGAAKIFWPADLEARHTRVPIPGEPASTRPVIDIRTNGDMPEALKPPASIDGLGDRALVAGQTLGLFLTICAMLIGGGLIQFFLMGFVIIVILSMMMSMLMSIIMSVVLLYMLADLSPIFVPLVLFKRTKGMFQSWLNLCLSMAMQPIIIIAFGAYVFVLIDSFMFNGCVFAKYDFGGVYEFQLRLPLDSEGIKACRDSLGFKLYQLIQSGNGWNEKSYLLFRMINLKDVYNTEGSAWNALVVLFLLNYVLGKVYELAASLTGGISLSGMVALPVGVFNAMKSMYKSASSTINEYKKNKDGRASAKEASGDSVGK